MSNVKLISTSSPNILYDIAYMARVSNPSNQNNTDTNEKLIRYLIKHKHWSPFEMASVALEINTTRDIAHQIVRHRSFAFQEFSQRYADPSALDSWPFELRETRMQDTKNRQNSIESEDELLHRHWVAQQKKVIDCASGVYKWALEHGIAKEQARSVLPEGLTKTRLYMQGTIRSWIHYIDVRTTPGTQKEHMDIAKECANEIEPFFHMIQEFVHGD
jgi:thymidylate synthase (FAD)